MEFREKLVQLRKEKGLSQMQVAEALDVSRQAISKWEVGDAEPSTANLIALAALYGVSLDYLAGNTDIRNPLEGGESSPVTMGEQPSLPPTEKMEEAPKRRKKLYIWLLVIVCSWICALIIGTLRNALYSAIFYIIDSIVLGSMIFLYYAVIKFLRRK